MRLGKWQMTRAEFEANIAGDWVERRTKAGLGYRQNGRFITAVREGEKLVSHGGQTLRAKTWRLLARGLGMVSADFAPASKPAPTSRQDWSEDQPTWVRAVRPAVRTTERAENLVGEVREADGKSARESDAGLGLEADGKTARSD